MRELSSEGKPSVLIFGGSGWLGKAITSSLLNFGLNALPAQRDKIQNLRVHTQDNTDNEWITNDGTLAIVNCLRSSTTKYNEAYIRISEELALISFRQEIPLFHIGSAAEYGSDSHELISEDSPTRPDTEYGETKLRASECVLKFGGTVIRPFNLVGPNQPSHTVVGEWVQQLKQSNLDYQTNLIIRNGAVRRDFVELPLIGEVIASLIMDESKLNVLNICSGRSTSFGEFAAALHSAAIQRNMIRAGLQIKDLQEGFPTRMIGDPSLLTGLGFKRHRTLVELAQSALD